MLKKIFLAVYISLLTYSVHAEKYLEIKKVESGGLYYVEGSLDYSGKNGRDYPLINLVVNSKTGYHTPNGIAHSVWMSVIINCPNQIQVIDSEIYYADFFTGGKKIYQFNKTYSEKLYGSLNRKFCRKSG